MTTTARFGLLVFGLCLISLFSIYAEASDSEPKLYGRWRSVKVLGTACRSQIKEVRYLFTDDYIYEIDAQMFRVGGVTREQAAGTYTLDGGKITGKVDGQAIGPFHYRFAGEQLVIEQGSPVCTIFLERFDEIKKRGAQ